MAWLTIQKFIIFYCPLDGEHTKTSPGGLFFKIYLSFSIYFLLISFHISLSTPDHEILSGL